MSVSFSCHCAERKKPVAKRRWRVIQRKCNHSRFNGSRYTPSAYSSLVCLSCGVVGRTNAKYVDKIEDLRDGEWR